MQSSITSSIPRIHTPILTLQLLHYFSHSSWLQAAIITLSTVLAVDWTWLKRLFLQGLEVCSQKQTASSGLSYLFVGCRTAGFVPNVPVRMHSAGQDQLSTVQHQRPNNCFLNWIGTTNVLEYTQVCKATTQIEYKCHSQTSVNMLYCQSSLCCLRLLSCQALITSLPRRDTDISKAKFNQWAVDRCEAAYRCIQLAITRVVQTRSLAYFQKTTLEETRPMQIQWRNSLPSMIQKWKQKKCCSPYASQYRLIWRGVPGSCFFQDQGLLASWSNLCGNLLYLLTSK